MDAPAQDCRVVCFDVDGTLVDETIFIWSTLHERFRTDPQARARAREDYFAGRLSYRGWFEHDIQLLRRAGADRDAITAVIRSMRLMPGARETVTTLCRWGYRLAVISGSIDLVLEELFPDHPFHHVLINSFTFDAAGRLIGGEHTPFDLERKADGLREVAAREGVSPSQCAFVGDHFNDVQVADVAGLAFAFNCKSPELAGVADVIVPGRDLRAILSHFRDRQAP
jgi:phosphoserine phosphatase